MFVDCDFRSAFLSVSLISQYRAARLRLLSVGFGIYFAMGYSSQATAHVKWFCDYDVAGQPRVLEDVLNRDFFALIVLALSVLLGGQILDRTYLGELISRSLDRVTAIVRTNSEVVIRAFGGFFFVALWTMGGSYLTPELKTVSTMVPIIQLIMAASLLYRATSWVAGLGIFLLFGMALNQYGFFHLLDYPIFLGIGAFLIVTALPQEWQRPIKPLVLLRWSAAVTLMWASIEKWAYPEWTLPIYISHPAMSMGYNFEFFMQAAGVIEFTLAFALLWSPLVRRAAAFVLLGMFIGAAAEFGKMDVIGHSMIVAVLLVLAADDRRPAAKTVLDVQAIARPSFGYAIALLAAFSVYYGLHAFLFGTAIV